MNRMIGLVVVCLLDLAGCNVEHYDDCNKEEDFEFDDDFGGSVGKAGKPSTGGRGPSTGGNGSGASGANDSTGEGGTPANPGSGEGGAATPMEPPATPCEVEHDCAPGFNCDLEAHECHAADAETCGELLLEEQCTARADCTPIYGGTNCSCGPDCECLGGEPGCICQEFGFVVCR